MSTTDTPTWTEADVAALRTAIASGVMSVSYSGPPSRTITYQSLEAMRSLFASMQASVRAGKGRKPYALARTRKGL